MTQEEIQKVAKAIEKKIGKLSCPMCKGGNFEFTTQYLHNILSSEINNLKLVGEIETITTFPISCKNCGFVSQHRFDFLLK